MKSNTKLYCALIIAVTGQATELVFIKKLYYPYHMPTVKVFLLVCNLLQIYCVHFSHLWNDFTMHFVTKAIPIDGRYCISATLIINIILYDWCCLALWLMVFLLYWWALIRTYLLIVPFDVLHTQHDWHAYTIQPENFQILISAWTSLKILSS